jgi:hypothetical protein
MRITHVFKETSKQAQYMRYDFEHFSKHRSIYDAYATPSRNKIGAWMSIQYDYETNNGLHAIQVGREFKSLQYNNDIRVTGASSHFFSTIASFTDTETGEIWLIKETHCNTYACLYGNVE